MTGCLPNIMGANASATLMKEIGSDQFPPNERYYGLHNFGNTCYCNSVLQALFFCKPFRNRVLQYRNTKRGDSNGKKDSLLGCLCELFHLIMSQKKKCGVLQPKKFVARLRKEYDSFDNYMQHDAHELFNCLLNSIHLVLIEEKKAERERKRLEMQMATSNATVGIKRERLSFFRSRKEKSPHNFSSKVGASSFASIEAGGSSGTDGGPVAEIQNSANNNDSSSSLATSDSPASTAECSVPEAQSLKEGENSDECKPPNGHINEKESTPSKIFTNFFKSKASKKSNLKSSDSTTTSSSFSNTQHIEEDEESDNDTWINDIFQGTYTTITRCLTCETVKNKDENFLDLSVDIEQNTSITHCLRVFSNQQTLSGEHKYFCEACRSKQEAQIQMRIKKLPCILALHLKRFKYCDTLNKYTKLTYRVVFPFDLRLFNTTDDASDPERLYDLIAVVVHCGSGPYRGHYVSIVKSHGMWLLFDDDSVEKMEPNGMEDFYGVTADKNSESGYILFYQSRDAAEGPG